MQSNFITYYRTLPSDSLLGGWKTQKVTRKAKNRKVTHGQRFFTTDRCWTFGLLVGTVLGSLYLQTLGNRTIHFIHSASAQEVHLSVSQPELAVGGETLAEPLGVEAGQGNSPSTPLSEKQEVMNYIIEVFGDDADRAIWIAKCESGLRKNSINDKNDNGSVDYGVFQVNSVHKKRHGSGFTTDWQENVKVAKKIFDEQGFRPWVCATAAGEKNYLSK